METSRALRSRTGFCHTCTEVVLAARNNADGELECLLCGGTFVEELNTRRLHHELFRFRNGALHDLGRPGLSGSGTGAPGPSSQASPPPPAAEAAGEAAAGYADPNVQTRSFDITVDGAIRDLMGDGHGGLLDSLLQSLTEGLTPSGDETQELAQMRRLTSMVTLMSRGQALATSGELHLRTAASRLGNESGGGGSSGFGVDSLNLWDDAGPHGVAGTMGDFAFGSIEQIIQQISMSDIGRCGAPPTAQHVMDALPLVAVAEADVEAGGECTVCKEVFTAGEMVRLLPCKHSFHEPCIMPWLRQSCTCPTCRHRLPEATEQQQQQQQQRQQPAMASLAASRQTQYTRPYAPATAPAAGGEQPQRFPAFMQTMQHPYPEQMRTNRWVLPQVSVPPPLPLPQQPSLTYLLGRQYGGTSRANAAETAAAAAAGAPAGAPDAASGGSDGGPAFAGFDSIEALAAASLSEDHPFRGGLPFPLQQRQQQEQQEAPGMFYLRGPRVVTEPTMPLPRPQYQQQQLPVMPRGTEHWTLASSPPLRTASAPPGTVAGVMDFRGAPQWRVAGPSGLHDEETHEAWFSPSS